MFTYLCLRASDANTEKVATSSDSGTDVLSVRSRALFSVTPVRPTCPGVAWRLRTWLQSLLRAWRLRRDRAVAALLSEFPSILTEDYTPELVSSGVPLLFDMLESTQVRALTSDL